MHRHEEPVFSERIYRKAPLFDEQLFVVKQRKLTVFMNRPKREIYSIAHVKFVDCQQASSM